MSDLPVEYSWDISQQLESNPHLFKLILGASGVAMSLRDTELRPIYMNQAFLDYYGYSEHEARNSQKDKVLTKETIRLYDEEVLPALRAGQSWEGEYSIRTASGRQCMVLGRFDPVLDKEGRFKLAVSVMRDASHSLKLRNALTQTERHLKFLSENTSDCLFRLRLQDGRYDYISSAVKSITGYTPQEFYQTPRLFDQLAPAEWKETLALWWREIQGGNCRYEYTMPIRHKTLGIRWVNQRVTVVNDDKGAAIAVEGIITDVTKAKEAEEALKASEEKFRFLAERMTDVVWLMDTDMNFIYATPSVKKLWGYTPDELVGLDYRELFTDVGLGMLKEAYELRALAEARGDYEYVNHLEMPHIHKHGYWVWSDTSVRRLYDHTNRPVGYQGVSRDISDRKDSENALRASEQKYRLLVENVTDVVWTQDNMSRFTYVTPSAEQLWGYPVEELMQLDYRDLFTPESRLLLEQAKTQRKAVEVRGNYTANERQVFEHLRKDGTTVWAESVVRRTFDPNGTPSGYLGVSRDITERKSAENALLQSENRFRSLFEESPISLWEEDLTKLKQYFDELKEQGVVNFREYFYAHPESLAHCASLVEVVAVNKATLDLLRASDKEDLIGNLDKVLTESSMAAFTEEMILLASGGCEYCGEITHRTLTGEEIWVVVHFLVPPEYKDSLSRVIVSLIDVTPRKRAEQALVESEERYRVVVENAQEGVMIIQDDKSLFVNEALEEMLGYSGDELQDRKLQSLVFEEDAQQGNLFFRRSYANDSEEEFTTLRLKTKQGEIKWVTLNIKPIMWGGRPARMEIVTDITPHKMLEKELRMAHAQMEERVTRRTAELSKANLLLTTEIEERRKAEEQILTLTQQLIRAQEDERQRISRDLHDNVAQDLSSIVLNMETLFDGGGAVEPVIRERVRSVAKVVRGAVASVRHIAYGLRPPVLDQLGLSRTLKQLCNETAGRTPMDVVFSAVGIENIKLSLDTEIHIYRMIQEALNNVCKHASASNCSVRLIGSHPDLLVRVADNGSGFDVEQRRTEVVDEKRMGLKSMEERARIIGATMDIRSKNGIGTRITFRVPIKDARSR